MWVWAVTAQGDRGGRHESQVSHDRSMQQTGQAFPGEQSEAASVLWLKEFSTSS